MKLKLSIFTAAFLLVAYGGFAQINNNEGRDANSQSAAVTSMDTNTIVNPPAVYGSDKDLPTRDNVIADDQIIQGSLGVGTDCIDGEVFGFNVILLKENNLRIGFDDTSIGLFPANDWTLVANETASGGANYFAIEDATAAVMPFKVMAGAPLNALNVAANGNVGFNTAIPGLALHTSKGDTPGLRLEQNGTIWTPQTWDIAGNEANFFIRDVTFGSKLPFRIQPNTPTSTLTLRADGKVGVGTWSPVSTLDVIGTLRIGVDSTLSNAVGMIRYYHNDFYGYDGTGWKSFTKGDSVATAYLQSEIDSLKNDNIYLNSQVNQLQYLVDSIFSRINLCCPVAFVKTNEDNNDAILQQNAPNPFNEQTSIKFYLPNDVKTAVLLFHDLTGKQLMQINITERGNGSVTINANQFSAGIYNYSLLLDGKLSGSKKMVLTEK